MRRLRILSAMLLLLLEIAWLARQPLQVTQGTFLTQATGMVASVELSARVEPDEAGLTFALEQVPPGTEPRLSVYSDIDLQYFLRPTGRKGSLWLPNLALSKFPAVLLSYTWELGYGRVSGEYLYIHKDYLYPWRTRREGGLLVYYATGVVGERVDRWVELNDWLPQFLGSPQQSVIIYAMPDEESYTRIIRGYNHLQTAAAFWSGTQG